jgi:hypothetical protein
VLYRLSIVQSGFGAMMLESFARAVDGPPPSDARPRPRTFLQKVLRARGRLCIWEERIPRNRIRG